MDINTMEAAETGDGVALTEKEREILILLDEQECSASDGMEAMLDGLASRGLLRVRRQPYLNGNAPVNQAQITVRLFYRTTKEGRRAALKAVGVK